MRVLREKRPETKLSLFADIAILITNRKLNIYEQIIINKQFNICVRCRTNLKLVYKE